MHGKTELTDRELFWTSTIRSNKEKRKDEQAGWDVLGRTYRGTYWSPDRLASEARPEEGTDAGVTHETNYLFGFSDTMVANVCPKRPSVSLKSRSRARAGQMRKREAVINDHLRRARAGKFLRKAVNMAHIYPRSFLKAQWDSENERVRFRTLAPHKIFFDIAADDWDDIRYIIEIKPVTHQVFSSRVKRQGKRGGHYRHDALEDADFGTYPDWLVEERQGDQTDEAQIARSSYQWTVVYEIYDFVAKRYLHFLDGETRALYEGPLPWDNLPNPFRLITFHDNLIDLGGMSDGQLAFPGVQRLNELSSLKMWHVKTAIPIGLVNTALLDDPSAFQEALDGVDGPGQYVEFEARQNATAEQVFSHTETPQMALDFVSLQDQVRFDTEFVIAMPANSRGQTGATDVATELSMIDMAQKTRNGDRQEQVYDSVVWMALAGLALLSQKITDDFYMDAVIEAKEEVIDAQGLGFVDDRGEAIPFVMEEMITESHPYNAEAQNDVAQFRKLQIVIPVLAQNPHVDQRKFIEMLLTQLHMTDLLLPEEEAQKALEAQAAAAMPGAEGETPPEIPQGPGAPNPDMVDPAMSSAAEGPMTGGQVTAGTGAQGDPGAAGLGINI